MDNTDALKIITSAAGTVDAMVDWVEINKTTGALVAYGRDKANISSATTTTLIAVGTNGNVKIPKYFSLRNKDASLANDVTIEVDVSSTLYEIHKATLATGDLLDWIEGRGFFQQPSSSKLHKYLRVANDVSNSTTSFADVTGLTYPLLSGRKYLIDCVLFHLSAATTTGAQFGYNIGAAPTVAQFANISGVTNSVTAGAISLGSATARDTAITAQTTGSANVTMTHIAGYIQPSADGTFAIRLVSEVSTSAVTVKAGSWLTIHETDN